jgi:dihydroorotate dehydrogenase electron transfer subunit
MADVPDRLRPYLRRAYSVADADRLAGNVESGQDHRPRHGRPRAACRGSPVRLLGPLESFGVSGLPRGARVAIVAGGIGAAPFPMLLAALRSQGVTCDFYLGGRNARELSIRTRFDGLVRGETVLASDDGSLGEKGFVTEALRRRLEGGAKYARVFACGPMPMFAALAKVSARLAWPPSSRLRRNGCGFGACSAASSRGPRSPSSSRAARARS